MTDLLPHADLPERTRGSSRAHRPDLTVEPTGTSGPIFYEVLVQAYFDSNDDGYGDLRGLIAKLDYLQWLGVDCLWLPPFYDSPRRDGGYDIGDYTQIAAGIRHARRLRGPGDEAHARHPRRHRPRAQPHLGHTPVVPGVALPTRRGHTATTTCGAIPIRSTPGSGSSSATPSRPTGPSTRCDSSSTGTGSSSTSPTSTTTTRPSRRRCSTSYGSGWIWASTAPASTRSPISSSARAPTAPTCRRPTPPSSASGR